MLKNKKNDIKTWQLIVVGFIIFLSVAIKIFNMVYWPKGTVKINGFSLNVLVADNFKHWEKGLGGRKNLADYDGMVFVFPDVKQHVFVMRDMKFPLDIIWFKKGVVVDIAPNLQPDFAQTEEGLVKYPSRDESDLVLEVPAGFAVRYGIKIGDKVEVFR